MRPTQCIAVVKILTGVFHTHVPNRREAPIENSVLLNARDIPGRHGRDVCVVVLGLRGYLERRTADCALSRR